MERIQAMQRVLAHFPDQPVVANCGATSRELAALGRAPNHLYILDAMGSASAVGLGLALALAAAPVDRVIVFEGDGALLMNLTTLASIGYHRPAKLLLVLLDNGSYASTGGQPTYAARLDLGALAQAAGLETLLASDPPELEAALAASAGLAGPLFLHLRIAPGNAPGVPLLLADPAVLGHDFAVWLAGRRQPPGS